MRKVNLSLIVLTGLLLLSACNRHALFYYPNRVLYVDPEKRGMPYELLYYPSLNGKKLCALLFRTTQPPKGIVVHFHGNFGNVSNHFLESQFLVNAGIDMLIFDYQGFGGSEGKPSPRKTVEDGISTVRFAETKNRSGKEGVLVLGQSIGAAIATVVAAREPLVKAAVLEAGFTSYPSIARAVMKRSFLLWPLYPFYPLLLVSAFDPIDHIEKISPRPIFFIHGTKDRIVPYQMSEKLFKKAREPKRFWKVDGADHLQCRTREKEKYEKEVSEFFLSSLQEAQK